MKSKLLLSTIFFISLFQSTNAQITPACNLVSNGSFELYSQCPTALNQVPRANNWFNAITASGSSSDFFHQCGFSQNGPTMNPVQPYPDGIGCTGIYANSAAPTWPTPRRHYNEGIAQMLNFCAGQKYVWEISLSKSPSPDKTTVENNISLQLGNAAGFPTPFDPVTECPTGFTDIVNVSHTLITNSWQQFSRTFTAPQNANSFIIIAECGVIMDSTQGYVFMDDIKIAPVDTMTVDSTTITTCDSAVISFTIPGCYGPYNFTIDNGTTTDTVFNVTNVDSHSIYPAPSGTYTITSIINNLGCATTLNIPITVIGGTATSVSQSDSICSGGSYTLPGGNVVTSAGVYVDTISNTGGCDSIITTTLSIVNAINTSQTITICTGQSYTLPGGSVVSATGSYIDTLNGTGGCDSIITTQLSVTPALTTNQSDSICTGQSYTLPGGSTVSVAGTYTDTLLSIAGCDSIVTTNLSVVPALSSSQNASLCTGQNYTLPGGSVVTTAGTYLDTLISVGGCDSIITTTVVVNPVSTSTQSPSICSNENYTLPGGTVVNTTGTYSDTLTGSNGCDSIITTTLTVNPIPVASTSANVTIQPGQNTTITAMGGGTYNWYPTTGLNPTTGASVVASPGQTTTYCVEVTSANNCKDTACVTVTVELPCPANDNLQVPNAFSPNGDNVNDEFCLQGWNACVDAFSILIYDRWGQKVYESIDPNFCWNGVFEGVVMDAQVYVYYIEATYLSIDVPVIRKGNISLLR